MNETSTTTLTPTPPPESSRKGLYITGGVTLLMVLFVVFYYFLNPSETERYYSAYINSLKKDNPEELQQIFIDKVEKGEKDALAKSSIYFIAHRYFDNNGDIYEIYDYVNANPAISFLKEAEEIYPGVFSRIKSKQIETGFNFDSMSAFLAYLEAVDNNGYSDIATLGTAANKHAELVLDYKKLVESESLPSETKELYQRLYEKSKSKSLNFFFKAQPTIEGILDGSVSTSDLYPADVVVGINQYTRTIQFYKALGIEVKSRYTAAQLFDFSSTYAEKSVPELYLFTNFLTASSLIVANEHSTSTVKVPLDRLVTAYRNLVLINKNDDFLDKTPPYNGTLSRLINAKTSGEKGGFSQKNVVIMANLHPSFKTLLLEKGWTEEDFK